jgi:hypothetical protein
MVTSP